MDKSIKKSSHRINALVLSVFPGFGQFYNRQFVKGLTLLILAVSYFVVFKDLLNMGLWGNCNVRGKSPSRSFDFLTGKRNYCTDYSYIWCGNLCF